MLVSNSQCSHRARRHRRPKTVGRGRCSWIRQWREVLAIYNDPITMSSTTRTGSSSRRISTTSTSSSLCSMVVPIVFSIILIVLQSNSCQ